MLTGTSALSVCPPPLFYPFPGVPQAIRAMSLLPPSSAAPPILPASALEGVDPTSPIMSTSRAQTTPQQSPEGALFHLASSFAPIPAKLVKRIQNLEYVDLRELLPDNIALSEKHHALTTPATQSVTPEQREITKLVTWVSCFSTYVAIAAQKHPERTRDMMAYMRLMVRNGYKHGGMGWLKYDCIFRKNNPGPSASWDVLDPSLLTIVANQGYSPRPPCHHCQELDHSPAECTLAPLAQPTRLPWQGRHTGYPRKGKRPAPYETAPSSGRYTPHDPPANFPSTSDGGPPRPRICISWNKGQCAFQGACTYAHICPTCNSGSHRVRDCPRTPGESFFKKYP